MLAEKNSLAQDKFNWIKLARSENVGPKTFRALIDFFGTPEEAIGMLPELASRGGLKRPIKICPHEVVAAEIETTEKFGARLIPSFSPEYPSILKTIDDYPAVISVLGEVGRINKQECVAIVGSRDASATGCTFAKKLAYDLACKEIAIVSGLARGIDAAAHKGSLDFFSIGIIAGGIDHVYPEENAGLYKSLSQKGAIISELPIGTAPLARHFPQRNRLISGISQCVAVIEASKNSGTLITARYAVAQGRQVFAVPGSPLDKRAGGTNQLIREGAMLLESAEDIVSFLARRNTILADNNNNGFYTPPTMLPTERELQKHRSALLSALSYVPTDLEEIVKHAMLPYQVASLLIIELELAGKVQRTFGNKICLVEVDS